MGLLDDIKNSANTISEAANKVVDRTKAIPKNFKEGAKGSQLIELDEEKSLRLEQNNELRRNLINQRTDDATQKCISNADVCCKKNWSKVDNETRAIADHLDDRERNKQINAAYADLYLNDPKYPKVQKWAGTAALVSKQVGCTMDNNWAASDNTLGVGNTAIFENIYPTIKMYELSQQAKPPMTYKELLSCLDGKIDKENIQELKLPLLKMFEGNGHEAAIKIAKHEQLTIIQNAMWNSNWMWTQATSNMILQGSAADSSVYFIGDCSKPPDRELKFPSWTNLSYGETRVRYYIKTFVPYFDKIAQNQVEMNKIMHDIRNFGATH